MAFEGYKIADSEKGRTCEAERLPRSFAITGAEAGEVDPVAENANPPGGNADLASIVRRSAGLLKVHLDEEGASEIARRSRGTPRVANRILRRVRDVAEVRHEGSITEQIAYEALELRFGVANRAGLMQSLRPRASAAARRPSSRRGRRAGSCSPIRCRTS